MASGDAGATWSEAHRLGAEDAVDSDLALAPDGTLRAVWDTKSAIIGASSRDGGVSWSEPEPISHEGEHNRHPRVFVTKAGVVAFWMEGARESTVLRSTAGVISMPGLELPPAP